MQMQDINELATHPPLTAGEEDEDEQGDKNRTLWEPSGSWWRDFLYFSGPGTSWSSCSAIKISLISPLSFSPKNNCE